MPPLHYFPFQTPVADNPQPSAISFEQALQSFKGYTDVNKIPPVLFRKVNSILAKEGISFERAVDQIAEVVHTSREAIRDQLVRHGQPSPSPAAETYPRREALLRALIVRKRY